MLPIGEPIGRVDDWQRRQLDSEPPPCGALLASGPPSRGRPEGTGKVLNECQFFLSRQTIERMDDAFKVRLCHGSALDGKDDMSLAI